MRLRHRYSWGQAAASLSTAIAGVLVLRFRLCFRPYLSFRYRRLDKRSQSPDPELHSTKENAAHLFGTRAIISLVGLLLAFLASEITIAVVAAKAISLPPGVAVYTATNFIRPLDIFVVLANVNLTDVHFVGSVTVLGLLNWLLQF